MYIRNCYSLNMFAQVYLPPTLNVQHALSTDDVTFVIELLLHKTYLNIRITTLTNIHLIVFFKDYIFVINK